MDKNMIKPNKTRAMRDMAGSLRKHTELGLLRNEQQKNNASVEGFALEYLSKLPFRKTINTLQEILNTDGWKISKIHDLQQSLKSNGQDVLPVQVIELCNPAHAGKMLANDDVRFMSAMMPCRISVYEKGNGNTYISILNSENVAKLIGGSIQEMIGKIQNEILGKITPLITIV